jgi:hypothetical protein
VNCNECGKPSTVFITHHFGDKNVESSYCDLCSERRIGVHLDDKGCMFDRFTDRARKVMALANQEAQRFNHEYIGTEHFLLGLIKEGSGTGANILKNLDVDIRKVRLEVEKLVKTGPDMVMMGKLPHTPRAKKVLEYAIEEARNLNHNYVGTEHLLLGLLREHDGVAAQVLINLNLKLEEVREEVINLLGAGVEVEKVADGMPDAPTPDHTIAWTFDPCKMQPHAKITKRVQKQPDIGTIVPKGLVMSQFEAADTALRQLVAALSPYGTVAQIQRAASLLEELRDLRRGIFGPR